jgi:hypothetical protein
MRYKRFLAGITALAASLALAPGASRAADYCVTFPTAPTYTLVGRAFVVPPKGKCKPWNRFTPQNSTNSPSVGTGCTSSDGSNFWRVCCCVLRNGFA